MDINWEPYEYDESKLPRKVLHTVAFLEKYNMWFRLSQNPPVVPCHEAARQRKRYGSDSRGIPLSDELKSLLCRCKTAHTAKRIMLHCRAHLSVDWGKVKKAIACSGIDPVEPAELATLGLSSGTVNPFTTAELVDIHVFDPGLTTYEATDSMMTNAGDNEWAVEFRAEELVGVFLTHFGGSAMVKDIARIGQ